MGIARHSLRQRILWAFLALALFSSLLFSFLNLVFVYAVEDQFFFHQLRDEKQRQLALPALSTPLSPSIQLYLSSAEFPSDLQQVFEPGTERTEYSGQQGRHYHLIRLQHPAHDSAVWLVTEVSQQLVVRPLRNDMLLLYAITTLLMVVSALLMGLWLARRATRPLTRLAELVEQEKLGNGMAAGFPDNEIGMLAKALEDYWQRVQAFITRERAFSRDASHELRTPLAVIQSSCELLLADHGAPEQQQRLLQIQQSCRQMNQQITTLLALSREEQSGQTETIRLAALLEQLILQLAPQFQHKTLELDLQADSQVRLQANPVILQMILTNLLQNAFSHSSEGCIKICIEPGMLSITNPFEPATTPEDITALFAKGRYSQGYGLGLGIVQRLCQQAGLQLSLQRIAQELQLQLSWPVVHPGI